MDKSPTLVASSPTALWRGALEQLRLIVPEATFNTLFADSQGKMGADGALVVQVSTPQARDWIEARLLSSVQDALRVVGYQGPISVSPPPTRPEAGAAFRPAPAPVLETLPRPGPTLLKGGEVALTFLNFDLYARGWFRTPTYYELFWQPVLGYVAYAYWRLAQVMYWSQPSADFTRRVRLDIQDSAAHLGVSRDLIRGKPARGLGGALKTLSDHGLAQVERHEAGRATVYTARFRRRLPLLSPAQLALLNQSQQEEHLDWLLAAGYDPGTWESLSEQYPSFVLEGDAQPSNPKLSSYVNPEWESEPLSQTGFFRTPVYYDLFLQPLIGPVAYAIWRVCKCLNWSDKKETYTQDTITSVYALAAILNCNRQKITGVKRRQDGVAYWQEGAFDKLREERLALIREEGSGSQVAYRMLVVNEPPLLCPSQIEAFPTKLREAHSEWLRKAQLQLRQWEQLSMDSLLSLID